MAKHNKTSDDSSSSEYIKELETRVQELETEVRAREVDVGIYRKELTVANQKLEGLIGRLNQELKVMHALQKQLVPTEIPNIQGFEFSSKFVPSMVRGGDYFDIFEHEDRSQFGIVVASCSGHMVSALLLSVLLRLSARMEARHGSSPLKIMQLLMQEVLPNLDAKDELDIFYGLFDRRDYNLTFTRMGKVSAFVQDYAGQELKMLPASCSAVTKNFTDEIREHAVQLNARDRLIIATRGLSEGKNSANNEYGPERLMRSILDFKGKGVHELRNQILFSSQKFTEGLEPQRDVTVVVAEVKDRVIKLAQK